ncbi:MAG: site-specific integrase [Planctomycetaceae bacterium]|nr:site-specific integrase [Planctomycetaceae bacterium]
MSSLVSVKDKTGEVIARRIKFYVRKEQQTIYLSKTPLKTAQTVQSRVDRILACNLAGMPYPSDVAARLGTVGDELHEKLSAVNLVKPRQSRMLKSFVEAYIAERTDWKPSTRTAFNTSMVFLGNYFGDVPLKSITAESTALFRSSMVQDGYAVAYIAGIVKQSRQVFTVAKRRKLIDENPFSEVETGSQVNKDRDSIVSNDEAQALIDACGNAKQRLIIALGFYAGLRIPSELGGLRASEIIWDTNAETGNSRDRFVVHSPKTERKGKATRICPVFPELRPYLLDVLETLPEGQDLLFTEYAKRQSMGGFFDRLATRAGIKLWEKPAQNMRLTASNRCLRQFGAICESEWIGHSQKAAKEHYLRVQLSDYEIPTNDPQGGISPGNSKNTGNFEKSRTYLEKRTGNQSLSESEKQVSKQVSPVCTKSVPEHVGNSLKKIATENRSALNYETLQNDATSDNSKNRSGRT